MQSRKREITATIRNGFPLRVIFRACPAEPDVGIFSGYAEIDEILTERGRSTSFLKITEAEERQIQEQCDEALYDDDSEY